MSDPAMTDHAELAACPFCGLTDSIDNATQEAGVSVRPFRSPAGGTACRVECACGASGPSKREGWAATEVWNRRSPQSILLAEIAALRGERDALIAVDEAGEPLRQAQRDRATQAERQRDAAAEWARKTVDLEIPPGDDPDQRLKLLSQLAKAKVFARTFLASMEPKT